MPNPVETQAWDVLTELARKAPPLSEGATDILRDPDLALNIDFGNSLIADDVWDALYALCEEQDILGWRDRMFAGEAINNTEDRAVLHTALRSGTNADVQDVLAQIQSFVEKTHAQGNFTDVVNIGIGGSDLGPRFVCEALRHLPQKLTPHFVSNVDGADIAEVLKPLNPDTTLIIIASKTFTTQETMMNAEAAKAWLGDRSIAKHMIAVSTNQSGVTDFGINPKNMFPFWDWVGGRFSVWSSIGISIALTYGFDVFQAFLNGAKAMDDHFCHTSVRMNMPIKMALAGVWYRNFRHYPAVAVLPYAQNLSYWSDYLQQLDMESNGKSVDRDGRFITDYQTGPIIFGQVGTNGQHAFHQWLHQGTSITPCEFITVEKTPYDSGHQRVLNAHAKAQAMAFAKGRENLTEPHRHYRGGRPNITVNLNAISPETIGQLMALYEHKVFVQGIIWNINSFDQWGVELGKEMAQSLLA